MNTWTQHNGLKVLAIAMLVAVLASSLSYIGVLPFAFYQLMNWVVVAAAILTAYQAYKERNYWLVAVFALVAIVFNPVAPLYFTPQIWQITDAVAALLFVGAFFVLKTK